MNLNRRTLPLILPVALLTSLTLVALGLLAQYRALVDLQRSRLDNDLAALGTQLQQSLRRLAGDQAPALVTFAVMGPDRQPPAPPR